MGKFRKGAAWLLRGGAVFVGCLILLDNVPTPQGAEAEHILAMSEVSVIDGDTLEIDDKIVSISGIDAPELGQLCRNRQKAYRCGLEAALSLRSLLSTYRSIVCSDVPGRPEAEMSCSVGDRDLGEMLLRRGYAVAGSEAPAPYRSAEQQARKSGLGIWRGEFVAPASWREGERLPEIEGEPVQNCDIKGRITAEGRKTYVVPTDPDYEDIEIDPDQGERLFCSDDEAELHGWRRATKRR
ncbi:MAG: thermonuclease family protein [Rhodovibrionaceae bacterium]|nr:thermonuclease family protein [Rhodovibrionaceae bacterium]